MDFACKVTTFKLPFQIFIHFSSFNCLLKSQLKSQLFSTQCLASNLDHVNYNYLLLLKLLYITFICASFRKRTLDIEKSCVRRINWLLLS